MKTSDERSVRVDGVSGLRVTEWTRHFSNLLYFTNPGWFDGGRQLLFTSDRSGRSELVALDLATGMQRAVTRCGEGETVDPYQTCVDPVRNRAVTWISRRLEMIDLADGERTCLFRLPDGWDGIIPSVTSDGRVVVFGMTETMPGMGFEQRFAAHPTSRILACDIARRETRILYERAAWLGHVNSSPADPDLVSFCHEGPWTKVEHRVWCCRLSDGRVWKAGPVLHPPACVGHEYWLADGRRVAYHGFGGNAQPVLGVVDVQGGGVRECRQPTKTKHTHSLDGELIVGDGNEKLPCILAWRFTGDGLRGPWILCRHGGGWAEQRRHVHPRIAPDGASVWFTSDVSGEPRVYSVELPDRVEGCPRVPDDG